MKEQHVHVWHHRPSESPSVADFSGCYGPDPPWYQGCLLYFVWFFVFALLITSCTRTQGCKADEEKEEREKAELAAREAYARRNYHSLTSEQQEGRDAYWKRQKEKEQEEWDRKYRRDSIIAMALYLVIVSLFIWWWKVKKEAGVPDGPAPK
jgi:hypothetical protein